MHTKNGHSFGISYTSLGRNHVQDQSGQGEHQTPISHQPQSVQELLRLAKSSYGIRTAGVVATRVVEIRPIDIKSMTQEQMAVAIAKDMSGKEKLNTKDRNQMSQALYDSIYKMVFQLANRYSVTCPDGVEDLAQDCMYRITSQLFRFDPKVAKFTTWAWWVCRSVLNKKYQVGKRLKNIVVGEGCLINQNGESMFENMPEKSPEGVQHHDCPGMLAVEMMDAIRALMQKYPKRKNLIVELFGNPDSEDFVMQSQVSIIEAAKASGEDYRKARLFYSEIVRPFFCQRFAE